MNAFENEASKLFHETEAFFTGLVASKPHLTADLQSLITAAADTAAKVEAAVPVMVADGLKYVETLLPTGNLAKVGDSIIDGLIAGLTAKKSVVS